MANNAIVMGIGGSIHDFSSCIVQGGELKCCIEDERLLRKKHAFYEGASYDLIRANASDACMDFMGVAADELELVVGNDILNKFYYHRLKRKVRRFELIEHHLSHAASAFLPSPFQEAAILTLDGGGSIRTGGGLAAAEPLEVGALGFGSGPMIEMLDTHIGHRHDAAPYADAIDPVTDSIGGFYGVLTYACGFGFHEEGKTMGLAPYGTRRYLSEMMKLVRLSERGRFECGSEQLKALYEMRALWERETDEGRRFAIRADLAWAGQHITELALIHAASYLKQLTGADCLCLAGGVALNSVANYKLYKTGLFKHFFIQPASGDNGTSIGAAYYGWHVLMEQPRHTAAAVLNYR